MLTEEYKKLLEQVTSPVDTAVVLIAGTAGFLLDAGLNFIGFLEPGYVGVTFATGALGIKKAFEARFAKSKLEKIAGDRTREALDRAKELRELLKEDNIHSELSDQLDREIQLFQKKITLMEDFENSLNEIIVKYRTPPLDLEERASAVSGEL